MKELNAKEKAKQFAIEEAKKLVPSKTVRQAIKAQGEDEFWNKLTPCHFASIFYNLERDWDKQNEMFENILMWSDDEKTNDELKFELEYRVESWKRLVNPEEGFIYKLEFFYHSDKKHSSYKGELDNWCIQTEDFQTALDYGKSHEKIRFFKFFKFNIEKTRLVKHSEKEKMDDEDFWLCVGEANYFFDENGNCITEDVYHEPSYMEMEKALDKISFHNAYVPFPYPFKEGDAVVIAKGGESLWGRAEESLKAGLITWISQSPWFDGDLDGWSDMDVGIKWRDTSDFAESANDYINFLWLEKLERSEFCKELAAIDEEFGFHTVTVWQHQTGLPCKLCIPQTGIMKKDGVDRIGVYNSKGNIVCYEILFAMSVCNRPEVLTDKDKVAFDDWEMIDIKNWIRDHQEELKKMADGVENMPYSVFHYGGGKSESKQNRGR